MHVHVILRIDVVERQPGQRKTLELGSNFGRKLRPCTRSKEEANPGTDQIRQKRPVIVNEIRNPPRRQNGAAMNEYHVQPHRKIGQPPRSFNRIGRGRRTDHQACGAQHAVAMCPLYRLVDFRRNPEIVSGENQPLH
jgi:hypothetical protein